MTAAFNNPSFREHGDGLVQLTEPLKFCLRVGEGYVAVHVPEGFVTDFASVPRPLWSIFPPFGLYQRAAILHDWLYVNPSACSKFLADALFREAMKELGVPLWRRLSMYFAVRIFGRGNF